MNSDARIVSLIASATEIVCALGLRDKLVGVSHECDYPPSIRGLPVCTQPKFDPDGTSYEIDQRVRAILQESLSVYRVDASLLDKLAPTHIVTQSHCEVCAVSLKDVEKAACELILSAPEIVSLHPDSLSDVWNDILRVGNAVGAGAFAQQLIAELKKRMANVERKSHLLPRKKLAFIEWIEPLMCGGNWMPTLIEMCNLEDPFGQPGTHSPAIEWKSFVAADPDFIVVAPCGFNISRTLEEMPSLAQRDGWKDLRAVVNNKVFVADGNQFFNRPGPRLVESLEILAEIARPERFTFGHQGAGWVAFDTAPISDTRA